MECLINCQLPSEKLFLIPMVQVIYQKWYFKSYNRRVQLFLVDDSLWDPTCVIEHDNTFERCNYERVGGFISVRRRHWYSRINISVNEDWYSKILPKFRVNSLKLSTNSKLCCTVLSDDRGEPAVSYRWTGWVWEITGWSSRLQANYRSFWRNL